MIQRKLKQLQAESDKRDAKMYANMFSHKTKDSSVASKVINIKTSLLFSCGNIDDFDSYDNI